MFKTLTVVIGGPACAWLVAETFIPSGQPGTNTAFVLAVLVAVIVAGVWWGIVAALISTALITYFFVVPRGPHLPVATLPVIAVFAGTVVVAGTLARRLAQARDVATASLAERELAVAGLARQVDRERDATHAFQSAVLQETLPAVRSATVEAFYRPAVSMYEIGGDWYDVLEQHEGRVTVTVGDIAGKGIPAAAEMVRLSKALRIYAAEGYAPGALLARVDAAMLDGTLREVFATAVCARFDPDALTLEYATAGHPAPLLVRAAGGSVFLDGCSNPPLTTGLVRSRSETVQLLPGDSVLFFTDGLIERRHRAIDDGFAELTAICASARTTERTLAQIVDTLTATFPTEDDVCIVRLSVNETEPVDPDATRPTNATMALPQSPHSTRTPAPLGGSLRPRTAPVGHRTHPRLASQRPPLPEPYGSRAPTSTKAPSPSPTASSAGDGPSARCGGPPGGSARPRLTRMGHRLWKWAGVRCPGSRGRRPFRSHVEVRESALKRSDPLYSRERDRRRQRTAVG